MADERKRIIEQTASTEIFDDDWFIKDSALHNTTKISQTVLKQEILKDVKGVVELTQAEYDALPSSKLTDGILYAIKDSEDIIGNIENAIDTLSGDIDDLEELVSTEMYNTAPMWSGSSYTFDDLVVYGIDGRLYRCIVRNSTANQFVSSEWQATDIKAELYLLLQRIAPQFIASSQSYTQVYYKGNLVLHTNYYGVNTFYVCKQDLPQGDTEWVENHWEEVNTVSGLSKYLMDKIAEAGQIDDVQVKTTGDYESVVDNKVAKIDLSDVMIEKSVPNLPQSVATFNDGSDLPLKSLTASIVPVQDLHGYNYPWAGGAGKNKFDISKVVTNAEVVNNGTSLSLTTNPQTNNCTAGAPNKLKDYCPTLKEGDTVTFSFESTGERKYIYLLGYNDQWNSGTSKVITDSMLNSTVLWYTSQGVSTATVSKIQFELGSSATSYAPYENICPISGWDEVNVTRCGGNLYAKANNIIITKHIPNGTKVYTQIFGGTFAGASLYGKSNTTDWISLGTISQSKNVITINRDDIIELKISSSAYGDLIRGNSVLMVSFTDFDDFESYNGQVYTIDLDGTRYGGTLDVVSGVLTVDRVTLDLGTLNWDKDSQNRWFGVASPSVVLPNLKPISSNNVIANLMCSQYKATSRNLITSTEGICQNVGGSILINDTYALANYDTTQFKTYMNGVQLVYELATPLTIQLTPTSIKSLDGVNNVFASTGDVTKLDYIANATDVIASLEARVTALES